MTKHTCVAGLALVVLAYFATLLPASAQWQVGFGCTPIGRGTGVTGFLTDCAVASGTANAIVLTPAFGNAPIAGQLGKFASYRFQATATSTTASTIRVGSTAGPYNVYKNFGRDATTGGEFISGNWYTVGFDPTLNGALGGWVILSGQMGSLADCFTQSYHQNIGGVAGQNISTHTGGKCAIRADQNAYFSDIDVLAVTSADPTSGPVAWVPSLADGTQPGGTPPTNAVTVGLRFQYTSPQSGNPLRDFNITYTTGTATGVGQASANGQFTCVLNNGGVGTSALTWKAVAIGICTAWENYMVANPIIGADWNDTSRGMSPLWTSTVGNQGQTVGASGTVEAVIMDMQYPITKTLQLTPINAGNIVISDGNRFAAAAITFTADTTNGSAAISNIQGANRGFLSQGMLLTGTGMPAGVYVKTITYAADGTHSSATLSAAATATNSGTTLTMNGIFIPLGLESNPTISISRSVPSIASGDRQKAFGAGALIGAVYFNADSVAQSFDNYGIISMLSVNAQSGLQQGRFTFSQGGGSAANAQMLFSRGFWITGQGVSGTSERCPACVDVASYYSHPPANSPFFTGAQYSLTGSDATSMIDLTGTWNTSGTPTAIRVNLTDTASNAAALLFDYRVGGVSKIKGDKGGNIALSSTDTANVLPSFSASKNWGSVAATHAMASFDSYGDASRLVFRRANGLATAATAVANSDVLGNVSFRGYYTSGGTAFTTNGAGIIAKAGENFTSAAWGTKLIFGTTPLGTTGQLEVGQFGTEGGFSVGATTDPGAGNALIAGNIYFAGLTSGSPSLKRTGASLHARLADDSAFAPFTGSIVLADAYLQSTPKTLAALGACNAGVRGARATITDAMVSPVFMGVITGGGVYVSPALCDGVNWVSG